MLDLVGPLNAIEAAEEAAAEGTGNDAVHYDHPHIEAFVMAAAQRGELNVRVDHGQGSITFGTDAFGSSSSGSSSSMIRTRLSRLANALSSSLSYVVPSVSQSPSEEDQRATFTALVSAVEQERERLSLNKLLATRRAELLAELNARRTKEEQSRKLEISRKQQEEDERRQQEELVRRERDRIQKELEALRTQETKKLAETLREKGTLKVDPKVRVSR